MLEFYKGKRVLITGHTGFKGSWMCELLSLAGAEVTGYSLEPPTTPSLYQMTKVDSNIHSEIGDIRDYAHLFKVFEEKKPEIVIHMAAQPIVRTSYELPVYTYETNVMGTVNVLECIRNTDTVRSVINVTTDKVYLNKEWEWGYRENEELNGFDPYSNSKSCSELVTYSYRNSFLKDKGVAVSTMRAGNVIGGGDFAKDRIVPDCIRAAESKQMIHLRNPYSIRPYQHVLEPVMAYLMVAQKQFQNIELADAYNIGPKDTDCLTTGELADVLCNMWNSKTGDKLSWNTQCEKGPHEANILRLDCSKIKKVFSWQPVWDAHTAIEKVVEWHVNYKNGLTAEFCMKQQIEQYLKDQI